MQTKCFIFIRERNGKDCRFFLVYSSDTVRIKKNSFLCLSLSLHIQEFNTSCNQSFLEAQRLTEVSELAHCTLLSTRATGSIEVL